MGKARLDVMIWHCGICLLEAIVEAGLDQIDEVRAGDGHLVQENGALDGAQGGVENGDWVGHLLQFESCANGA